MAKNSFMHITVLGATGQAGRPLIDELLVNGAHVRAVTRQRSDLVRLPAGVHTIAANLNDVESLKRAFDDVDAVYYIPPTYTPREEDYGRHVIEAASQDWSTSGLSLGAPENP